jgi:hypothetical protein
VESRELNDRLSALIVFIAGVGVFDVLMSTAALVRWAVAQ